MGNRLVVLGGGESGVGAAYLAFRNGIDVFLSEKKIIKPKHREILIQNNIDFEEGLHSIDLILEAKEIIKSPGIPNNLEIIKEINRKKIPIISEIEFAFRFTNAKIIAVTGSNGKTTTTSLIYETLKFAKLNVGVAGNIGNSFSFLVAVKSFDYIVLEISSFQLDHIFKFKPKIAVITNITKDHLERYNYNFQNYINSKFNIIKNQLITDFFVYDLDDKVIKRELKIREINSKKISISFNKSKSDFHMYLEKNKIHSTFKNNKLMISIDDLSLKGKHNTKNSMAAATVAQLLNIENNVIKESLSNFQSINHRMEHVLTIQKVKYINDSKATNVNAVYYALDTMKSPTIWIVGGIDKGNDYDQLFSLVRQKVKAIVCIGVDNKKIIEKFSSLTESIFETTSMMDAVSYSYKLANTGDNVLLSPACSSFDLFENYEDRGNQFKECVRKL
ncbi:MAG: UDP-N-acetylmuramoyl-L-alanine--D-glutamate ligase [Flavobacteriaceae bacterium]|nr:UDP-N-acetylmuramoyl-L-alanine--D-glutamate ligase [Flavobacteriaceae bacterium]|tara:strand:+ start:1876 stop:3216 length:1341 start_codon:yes stop_codon:yes gene_type:complete